MVAIATELVQHPTSVRLRHKASIECRFVIAVSARLPSAPYRTLRLATAHTRAFALSTYHPCTNYTTILFGFLHAFQLAGIDIITAYELLPSAGTNGHDSAAATFFQGFSSNRAEQSSKPHYSQGSSGESAPQTWLTCDDRTRFRP